MNSGDTADRRCFSVIYCHSAYEKWAESVNALMEFVYTDVCVKTWLKSDGEDVLV